MEMSAEGSWMAKSCWKPPAPPSMLRMMYWEGRAAQTRLPDKQAASTGSPHSLDLQAHNLEK